MLELHVHYDDPSYRQINRVTVLWVGQGVKQRKHCGPFQDRLASPKEEQGLVNTVDRALARHWVASVFALELGKA